MKSPLDSFEKIFESRIRLGIMSALSVNDSLDFISLKEYLNVTDGNLATHLKMLQKVCFINDKKSFINNKPNTKYFLTEKGKKAFNNHLITLEKFLNSLK